MPSRLIAACLRWYPAIRDSIELCTYISILRTKDAHGLVLHIVKFWVHRGQHTAAPELKTKFLHPDNGRNRHAGAAMCSAQGSIVCTRRRFGIDRLTAAHRDMSGS